MYRYQYRILSIRLDHFKRWVELVLAQDVSHLSAARAIVTVMGHYGYPDELLSDNSPELTNLVIQNLTQVYKINHQFSILYSHEENGMVERANIGVMRHVISSLKMTSLRYGHSYSLWFDKYCQIMSEHYLQLTSYLATQSTLIWSYDNLSHEHSYRLIMQISLSLLNLQSYIRLMTYKKRQIWQTLLTTMANTSDNIVESRYLGC